MQLNPARVRAGEWIIGVAAAALLLCTFLLPWYGLTGTFAPTEHALGRPTTASGWNTLETLRWLILITGAAGIAVLVLQASRPAPALPVCFTVIATALAMVLLLGLIYRVLINQPESSRFFEPKGGAYAGLVCVAAIIVGGYMSLREDGVAPGDAPSDIETLRLLPRAPAS